MSIKTAFNEMLDEFKIGKVAIDMSYQINSDGSVNITEFSVHKPYEWDGKQDPVYISFNTELKQMHISNLSYADLNDPILSKLFLLPEGFGDF